MGFSVKNDEVERMIRELAARRGASMTEALRQLLAEEETRAAAAREAIRDAKVAAIRQIQREIAAMPIVSDMTDDEILGYDDAGIPSR